jgi:hypothetical protein
MTAPSTRTRTRWAIAAIALALPLAACGGDDSSNDDAAPATTAAADASAGGDDMTSEEAEDAAADMIEGAVSGDGDGTFGLDLETRVTALDAALDFEDYSIDGTTLTLVFGEGTVESDGMIACIGGGAVMGEDETLVVEYPDGTKTC